MSVSRDLGLSEEEIFRAVTSSPAKALQKVGEWGILKEGGNADICVLDYGYEPYSLTDKAGNMVENKKGYQSILTISDGNVVYRR
jgi:predicted amidohydrolase YtcJ